MQQALRKHAHFYAQMYKCWTQLCISWTERLCPCGTCCTHSTLAAFVSHTMPSDIQPPVTYTHFSMSNTQWCNSSFNSVKSPSSATRVYYIVLHFPIGRKITGCDSQWSGQLTEGSSLTCQLVWEMLRHACTTKLYCGVHHITDLTQNATLLWTVSKQSFPAHPSNWWMSQPFSVKRGSDQKIM